MLRLDGKNPVGIVKLRPLTIFLDPSLIEDNEVFAAGLQNPAGAWLPPEMPCIHIILDNI